MTKNTQETSRHEPRLLRDDTGAVAVIVALSMIALIAFLALVIDVGSLYAERRKLQTAADAAALAGAQELPGSPTRAQSVAAAYVAANAAEAGPAKVTVSTSLAANDTVKVEVGTPSSPLSFSGLWGRDSAPVGTSATARIMSPTSYDSGVMPIGVFPQGGHETPADSYGFGWGVTVDIKAGGGSGTTGNYGWIVLGTKNGAGGPGGLKDVITGGGGSATLWEYTDTDPGNESAANKALIDYLGGDTHTFSDVCQPPDANGIVHLNPTPLDPDGKCPRLVIIPIIVNPFGQGAARYQPPSGKKQVEIVGFAQFFITDVGSGGKNATVTGRFVRTMTPDEVAGGAYNSSGQVHVSLVQ